MGRALNPIFVTGATGYLGGRIMSRAAAEGIAAVGTSRSGGDGVIACDLRDAASCERLLRDTGAHCILHCAALVPKSAEAYNDSTAAEDSLAMVDSIVAARPARIVFASSMSVYPRETVMPIREEDAGFGETAYAAAKRKAEQRLMEGVANVTCLRLPGLFGAPRRGGLLFNAARALATGGYPRVDDDPPLWAALHVEDAADLCLRAAQQARMAHGIVNAGYPTAMSVTSAVTELAARLGRSIPAMRPSASFEMDLTRLRSEFGLPVHSFSDRLDELVRDARRAA